MWPNQCGPVWSVQANLVTGTWAGFMKIPSTAPLGLDLIINHLLCTWATCRCTEKHGAGMCPANVKEIKPPDALPGHKGTSQGGRKLKQNDNKSEALADMAASGPPSPNLFQYCKKYCDHSFPPTHALVSQGL